MRESEIHFPTRYTKPEINLIFPGTIEKTTRKHMAQTTEVLPNILAQDV